MSLTENVAKIFIVDRCGVIAEHRVSDQVTIGTSTSDCDIVVNTSMFVGNYGKIYLNGEDYYFKNLTDLHITYINKSQITENDFRLADGDIINICVSTEDTSSSDNISIIFLRSYSGHQTWKEMELSDFTPITIGREKDRNIIIADKRISRNHAMLRYDNNSWMISDCNSKNGVHHNGRRIVEPTVLLQNDIIRMVSTYFIINGAKLSYITTSETEDSAPFLSTLKVSPVSIPPTPVAPPSEFIPSSGPRKLKIEWKDSTPSTSRDIPKDKSSVSLPKIPPVPTSPESSGTGPKKIKIKWQSLPDSKPVRTSTTTSSKEFSSIDKRDSMDRSHFVDRHDDDALLEKDIELSKDRKSVTIDFGSTVKRDILGASARASFDISSTPIVPPHTHSTSRLKTASYDIKQLNIQINERSVRKKMKKLSLLKNINMNIQSGEFVLILGGSGAGKTTFMNAVMGYEKADGRIIYNGIDIYSEYERMKYEIGFVPQQDLMRDSDTVYDTLDNSARMKLPGKISVARRQERVHEVLELLGLSREKDSLVSKLSGGQRKRLSIAIEYIADPSLFFLDEPDSGLDGIMARSLMDNLRTIADYGKIVMIITHAPDRAAALFDKVIVLAKSSYDNCGKLAFFGSVNEAYSFFDTDSLEGVVRRINRTDEGGDGKADYYIEKFESMRGGSFVR